MNFLIKMLIKLGIQGENLDYHLIRAGLVVIFFFFGYQKWFEYEAQALIPYISHGPLIFWMYAVFRHSRGHLFSGGFGMGVWRSLVLRILEQEIGNPRGARVNFFNDRN